MRDLRHRYPDSAGLTWLRGPVHAKPLFIPFCKDLRRDSVLEPIDVYTKFLYPTHQSPIVGDKTISFFFFVFAFAASLLKQSKTTFQTT